jgi:DNA end-binding protein Ku
MLGPNGVPLSRRYYSQKTNRNLDDDEMVRGYEIKKGKYIPVTDEELERIAPEKTRDIDLRLFVDRDSIAPIYYERTYFLTPAANTEKAYRLLAETLEDSRRAGIGTFVMRGKEYLVVIFSENGILHASTLRFADELRSPGEVGLPDKKPAPKASVQRFKKMIERKSEQHLTKKETKDEETDRFLKLVKKKRSRRKDIVEVEPEKSEEGKVVDIMDVLKKSIAQKRAA